MTTPPRRTLPLFADLIARRPPSEALRVEQARQRLGGPCVPCAEAGRLVTLRDVGTSRTIGVVLHQTERDVDVWVSATVVRRVRRDAVEAVDATDPRVTDALHAASADARVFGAVTTGARVTVREPDGRCSDALLVDRCRYGAVVARDDGTLMAVGFRALWARERQG